jgi:hypothetical protein
MGVRTLIWGGFFFFTCIAALGNPIWGIVGYVGHYSLGPEKQWWAAPINSLELRYSLTLAVCTGLGMLLHIGKLRSGPVLLVRHEKLMLAFLGLVWLMTIFSPETVGKYTGPVDHPSIKLTKTLFFVFMMTHVVTYVKNFDKLFWILAIGALVLGIQAYEKPYSAFVGGRLEGVGGPDFGDSNRLGGYMAGMLFIVGAQFMRSKPQGKLLAFLAGGFTANAVVLCRSRGAFLGVAAGMLLAAVMAPKGYRDKVFLGLLLACIGGLVIVDPQFLNRMSSINESSEERDASANSRLEIWTGAVKMISANPIGVGTGNFYQRIGDYVPKHPNRDAHSTVFRCGGELGLPGLGLFAIIVLSAYASLRRTIKIATSLPGEEANRVMWAAFGAITGLTAILTYGMTGTLIYTEYLWWMLGIPVCLERVIQNLILDQRWLHQQAPPLPVNEAAVAQTA